MSASRRPGNASHPSRNGNRPLYAIDFTAVACGKRIANTKRRVRWRFGFANPDALAAGETGTACRGEEHDITLVWSVTSGKRLILADGQEVHYSNSRSAIIDFSWTMRGNHVLKVVAHATAPMSADPGFRQYDFFVDGRSFFSFPKVYRLGLSGNRTVSPDNRERRMRESGGYPAIEQSGSSSRRSKEQSEIAQIEAPHNQDEEEAYLREAIKASLESEKARKEKGEPEAEKPKISAEATDLLIDFMDDFQTSGNTLPPAPSGGDNWALAPAPSSDWALAPAPATNNWSMAPASTPTAASAPAVNDAVALPVPTPVSQPNYDQFGGANALSPMAQQGGQPNPFAPVPSQPIQQNFAPMPASAPADPFAAPAYPQTSVAPIGSASGPATSYGQDPFAAPGSSPAPAPTDPFAPQPSPTAASAGSPAPAPSNVVLTMSTLNGTDSLLGSTDTKNSGAGNMADKALQNLMGSIDSFGLTGTAAKPPDRKNPFDSNNIMSNTTLGEMKAASANKQGAEKKPVMNSPPKNALVVAGNQSGNWGGYGQQLQQQTPQYQMAGSVMQPPGGQGYQQYPMSGGYQQQPPMYGGQMGMGMGQQPMQQPMQQAQYGGYGGPPPPQYQQQQQQQYQQQQWGAPSYQ